MVFDSRAMFVTRHGGPEVLEIEGISLTDPPEGHVLLDTRAVGVNLADVYARMGLYDAAPAPAFVPGFEAAGVVRAVGPGVEAPRVGDRVAAVTRFGGYAEMLQVPAWQCIPIPEPAGFEEAAGLPTVYATAHYALFRLGQLTDGMTVLIHAAAGGVGTAALQLCRLRQVVAIGTVGSAEKAEVARSQGAAHVVDYRRESMETRVRELTGGRGVDLVLDSVGGDCFRQSYRLLAPMGRLVTFGAASMMPAGGRPNWAKLAWQYVTRPRLDPLAMIGENRSVSGFNLVYLFGERPLLTGTFSELARLWREGRVKPLVGTVLPFARAGEAQELLRSRRTTGKVILQVPGGG
ncbi:MAG: zinc-binding dehydrogenase [Candidatus Riflebacteria bacterium]|nr:zinc-binding dehydrogenase [Candidatus Riflebacteria bacterium]